ncbi:MAG: hypothetical protein QF805_10285 [Pirellulaceae bacterium]|nr:hypothetical protein [Pirellulaceae bacterium]
MSRHSGFLEFTAADRATAGFELPTSVDNFVVDEIEWAMVWSSRGGLKIAERKLSSDHVAVQSGDRRETDGSGCAGHRGQVSVPEE